MHITMGLYLTSLQKLHEMYDYSLTEYTVLTVYNANAHKDAPISGFPDRVKRVWFSLLDNAPSGMGYR